MSDVYINEVHTDLQITEGVGTLAPAEVRKLVALVMAQLKAQQYQKSLSDKDDRLHSSAYMPDVRG